MSRNLQEDLITCNTPITTPMDFKMFGQAAQAGWPYAINLLLEVIQLVVSAETVDVDITAGGKVYRTKFCPYCKGQQGHNDECSFIELMTKLSTVSDERQEDTENINT